MYSLKNNLCEKWDIEWVKFGTIKVLILGSIPGIISNSNQFYYSSGYQMIWNLLDSTFKTNLRAMIRNKDFVGIVKKLSSKGIALSDIYSYADKTNKDSSDSSIIKNSRTKNENLLNYIKSNQLKFVLFNGKYQKDFEKEFGAEISKTSIRLIELPSLSGMNRKWINDDEKKQIWLSTLLYIKNQLE